MNAARSLTVLLSYAAFSANAEYVYALSLRLEFRGSSHFPCYFHHTIIVQISNTAALQTDEVYVRFHV
jgi:hypothetical protein